MSTRSLTDLLAECTVKVASDSGSGSGFWISHNQVVTCAHVAGDGELDSLPSIISDGEWISVTGVRADRDLDIALLTVPDGHRGGAQSFVWTSSSVRVGDRLFAFGYTDIMPDGEPVTLCVEGVSRNPPMMKLKEGQVRPGLSGAPLLNLRTGGVCGVVRKSRDRVTDLGGRAVCLADAVRLWPEVFDVPVCAGWARLMTRAQQASSIAENLPEAFQVRVGDIYRLLHYTVHHDRVFGTRKAELFIERRIADHHIYRVIACLGFELTEADIGEFASLIRSARLEFPTVQGTIVCAGDPQIVVQQRAREEGIAITSFRALEAQLLDGEVYARRICSLTVGDASYNIENYIPPRVSYDIQGADERVFDFVSGWLNDPDSNQLTLLGDVGTGKTFLTRVIANRLAQKYLDRPHDEPLPIRIDLRNADRHFVLEGLVLSHFAENGLPEVSFNVFMHALSRGRIVLILDGFDEMAARVTPRITERNFHQLARAVVGSAKVILTCRTHYFRSRTEEEEVIQGGSADLGSDSARELYWDLVTRKGFAIGYLRPFSVSEVEAFVDRVKGSDAPKTIEKIRGIYNLMELCERPLLLDMIVKSIDRIDSSEITAAELYRIYTDAWISRDRWRDVLSRDDKLEFVQGLARSLWAGQLTHIHHSQLTAYVEAKLAALIQDSRQLIEIDSEIRTSAFLTRDESGNYGVAHKSYREYFLARYLSSELESGNSASLAISRLTPEVCSFIVDIVDGPAVVPVIERVLTDEYLEEISENSLCILYELRRRQGGLCQGAVDAAVKLPDNMRLSGANLEQITLERAVCRGIDLSGASLQEASMSFVDMTDSDLSGVAAANVKLDGAIMIRVDASNAILRGANLDAARLDGANIENADLNDAILGNARAPGARVRNVKYCNSSVKAKPDVLPEGSDSLLERGVRSRLPQDLQHRDLESEGYNRILSICREVAGSYAYRGDIEPADLASEAWLYMDRNGMAYDESRYDIYRIVRTVARFRLIDERRRIDRRRGVEVQLTSDLEARLEAPPEGPVDATWEVDRFEQFLEELLPPIGRRIGKMRFVERMEVEEIATQESLSVPVVRRWIMRIRDRMRSSRGFSLHFDWLI